MRKKTKIGIGLGGVLAAAALATALPLTLATPKETIPSTVLTPSTPIMNLAYNLSNNEGDLINYEDPITNFNWKGWDIKFLSENTNKKTKGLQFTLKEGFEISKIDTGFWKLEEGIYNFTLHYEEGLN